MRHNQGYEFENETVGNSVGHPQQVFQSPSIQPMSCFEDSLEASDSELLPCSCSASWKLHSIAINVLGSSEEEKKGQIKYLFQCICDSLHASSKITVIHVTWSWNTAVFTCRGSDYLCLCDGLFCLFFLVDFHGHDDDGDEAKNHQNNDDGKHR